MTTYQQKIDSKTYRYFYDPYVKSWTIYEINDQGYQVGDADYHATRANLKANYPGINFRDVVESINEQKIGIDQIKIGDVFSRTEKSCGTTTYVAMSELVQSKVYKNEYSLRATVLETTGSCYKKYDEVSVTTVKQYSKFGQVTKVGKWRDGEVVNEDYSSWKRKNVTYRGIKNERDLYSHNGVSGLIGNGLYTVPASNKAMAREYGKVHFVVNAKPKNPLVLDSINAWEIWSQQNLYMMYAKGEFPDIRAFEQNTTIEAEMQKLGYDGVIIKGREMVNFTPKDVKIFSTETELELYYNNTPNLSENKGQISTFTKAMLAKYPDLEKLELYGYTNQPERLHLGLIQIAKDKRGSGVGSEVMQDIVDFADSGKYVITLTPDITFGATSTDRLRRFYKQFGFVDNKGRNKDFKYHDAMYRPVNESIDLFHGSKASFDSFSLRYMNSGSGDGGWLGRGIYLTNDYDYAKSYGNVYHCRVNVKNPLVLTDPLYSRRPLKLQNKYGANNNIELTHKLKTMGYDSVLLTYKDDDGEDFVEICVFDPTDIKILKRDIGEALKKIKRKWTDQYPAVYINPDAALRNKIVEFIGSKAFQRVKLSEFNEFRKMMAEDEDVGREFSKSWVYKNKHLITPITVNNQKYYKLTKLGKRVYDDLMQDKEEVEQLAESLSFRFGIDKSKYLKIRSIMESGNSDPAKPLTLDDLLEAENNTIIQLTPSGMVVTELFTEDAWFEFYRADGYQNLTKGQIIKKVVEEQVTPMVNSFGGRIKEWNFSEDILTTNVTLLQPLKAESRKH